MTRTERHRCAVAACLRFARDHPALYDELADGGELREWVVAEVDAAIGAEEAAHV